MEYWNCLECGAKLIWQNDYDFEDLFLDGEGIVRMFSCPNCGAFIEVYIPANNDE